MRHGEPRHATWLWIPAFAGMTEGESGNDKRGSEKARGSTSPVILGIFFPKKMSGDPGILRDPWVPGLQAFSMVPRTTEREGISPFLPLT